MSWEVASGGLAVVVVVLLVARTVVAERATGDGTVLPVVVPPRSTAVRRLDRALWCTGAALVGGLAAVMITALG